MKLTQEERSWILYDCGNSAYSMAITTALLPVYYGMIGGDSMNLGYVNSIASILIACLSPALGAYADYRDKKKRFFAFFALTGILTTAAMATTGPGGAFPLAVLYILSSVTFAAANIFYDAFLVDVTSDEKMDTVSAMGFAYGYIASIIPFGISLGVVATLGMDRGLGYRLSFLITALWWGLLTIPMLRHVRQKFYVEPKPHPVRESFRRLFHTLRDIRSQKLIFTFLAAYFLYIDGVDTIIKMVVPYAESVLGKGSLDTFLLLGILLIIQIIAFPCALLYGKLARRYGAKTMILVGIVTYMATVIYATFITSVKEIFILGALVGTAQGGIQALSRSYYAKIIPKDRANEFFGFYNIFGKFAAIIGPFIMALITSVTGNARASILGIIPLFVLGFLIMLTLPKEGGSC